MSKLVYMSDLSLDASRAIQLYEQAVVAEADARHLLDRACKAVMDSRQAMITAMLAESALRANISKEKSP